MSLRDRSLYALDAAVDVFGFNKGRTWANLKKDISGDQIREFYRHVAYLWPPSADLSNLMPEPGDSLRALYLGDVNPNAILSNVFRFALYTDEILIVNPLVNPWCRKKEYNPLEAPDQFKMDTLKLLFFLFSLAPWIGAGLVTLIPDPGDFDSVLRVKTWSSARKRLEGVSQDEWKAAHEEMASSASIWETDFTRLRLMEPKEYQARKIRDWK
ncbi:MAG: hypothetical protein Q7N50_14275, partial [Armatimonadota bacterium]|nr:hypothetical protein [Armatimonadota bacterium]